jgi:catechol 2,3-dioxygenase-like lactoylglutathione lyase family enzyme
LAVATATADGRPVVGPVDGIFYRGAFHFGSSPDSVRFRHIRTRPQISATHLPGEELAVTVHGRAAFVDVSPSGNADLRRTLLEVYTPRYGTDWEKFLDSGPVYARIDAERMFAFALPEATDATASPRLDHVQIAAPAGCEEDARRFFGDLLGLAEIEKPAALRGRGGAWFVLGEQQLHVGVEEPFAPARKAHPALRVSPSRLDQLAERLGAARVAIEWDDSLPGERRFYTEDPWGNRLELLAASGAGAG